MTREGPFWDAMEGRAAPPPSAVLLGWELVSIDPDAGTIEVAFAATAQFLNPAGVIQGGFVAAMLDRADPRHAGVSHPASRTTTSRPTSHPATQTTGWRRARGERALSRR